MTSAILVLKYMPDMCRNCPLFDFNNRGEPICNKENKCIDSMHRKPDWCPLVELPKYSVRDYPEYDRYVTGYDDGWDACINEILGENYE